MPKTFFTHQNYRRIHLGSVVAALILFFTPWLDVRCSGERLIGQNGVQIIYGGASAPPGLRALVTEEMNGKSSAEKWDETEGIGWLTGMAFLSLLIAVAWAFYDFRLPAPGAITIVGNLCGLTLILLLLQFAVGFPVETAMESSFARSLKTGKTTTATPSPARHLPSSKTGYPDVDRALKKSAAEFQSFTDQTTKSIDTAMALSFTVDTHFWLYLELLALAIPTSLRIRNLLLQTTPTSAPPAPWQPRPITTPARGFGSQINNR